MSAKEELQTVSKPTLIQMIVELERDLAVIQKSNAELIAALSTTKELLLDARMQNSRLMMTLEEMRVNRAQKGS